MSGSIKQSLTRKLGPFPVWAWVIGVGAILYVVRSRTSGGAGTSGSVAATQAEAGLVAAEGQASALNTQQPQILAPGEQVYDPNTGAVMGGAPDNSTTNSIIGLIGALMLQKPAPASVAHKTKNHKTAGPKTSNGVPVAPGGAHKPKAPKGYHTVGKGHGRWQFVLNSHRTPTTHPKDSSRGGSKSGSKGGN